jgi:hypothetical protein
MKKLQIEAVFEYDDEMMYKDDEEGREWFYNLLLSDELLVHSNEIGDTIGALNIVKIAS